MKGEEEEEIGDLAFLLSVLNDHLFWLPHKFYFGFSGIHLFQ